MKLNIRPCRLQGTVQAPPSKSAAHRALICACLAGKGRVENLALSEDVSATLSCLRALGADVRVTDGAAEISGFAASKGGVLDCGESGSTLRFLLPLAGVLGAEATFTGRGRLPERTYGALIEQMARHGMAFDRFEGLPLACRGKLEGGEYCLPGNVSSQFLSGLLLALPLAAESSSISLSSPLESRAYVELTLSVMERFGVQVRFRDNRYEVPGGQRYVPCNMAVEGDYSNAAFWFAAGALGGDVTVRCLDAQSRQGDRSFPELLSRMGAAVSEEQGGIRVRPGALRGIEADVSQIPDLVPVLAVVMARAKGVSAIRNAGRLRIKECDRLHATAVNLEALGVRVRESADALEICGTERFLPARVSGWNDHRMVMAMAIAGCCGAGAEIDGCLAVRKSYPDFFEDFKSLGGDYVHIR